MALSSPPLPDLLLVLLLLVLLQLPGPRRLAHLATHDSLTGLANRALFAARLDHALTHCRHAGRPGALLLLDLDDFKQINDAHGHAAGDRALIAVAARLRDCLGEADTVARLGGDEFAVLLDGPATAGPATAAVARATAERIRAALAAPLRLGDPPLALALRASIGVAVFDGTDGAADLLDRADRALYAAKRAKRGGGQRLGYLSRRPPGPVAVNASYAGPKDAT